MRASLRDESKSPTRPPPTAFERRSATKANRRRDRPQPHSSVAPRRKQIADATRPQPLSVASRPPINSCDRYPPRCYSAKAFFLSQNLRLKAKAIHKKEEAAFSSGLFLRPDLFKN